MSRRQKRIARSMGLLTAILILGGCSGKPNMVEPGAPAVTVAVPVEGDLIEYSTFTGRLEAVDSVVIRAMVGGYLTSINFVEGALVSKDDVLFEIDRSTYKADLDQAFASLRLAKAQMDYFVAEENRVRQLRRSGAASPEDEEKAVRAADSGRAGVDKATADAARQQINYDYTWVKAPINGRIGKALRTKGNLITGGTTGATDLTTLVSIAPIYAYFDVDEQTLIHVRKLIEEGKLSTGNAQLLNQVLPLAGTFGYLAGQTPLLSTLVSNYPNRKYSFYPAAFGIVSDTGFPNEGYLDFVNNQLDPSTGTMRVRGVFPNPDGKFTPGMFVRVRVPVSEKHPVLLIDDQAVVEVLDQKIVYVINEKNEVTSRPIQVGSMHKGLRIVESGLKPGDRVVVSGLQRVRPGATVKPTEGKMDALEKNEGQ